eukprot:6921633-Pyramimonas_sp.AAC.1
MEGSRTCGRPGGSGGTLRARMRANLQVAAPAVLVPSMEGQSAVPALQNGAAVGNHKYSARCGQKLRYIRRCTPHHVACEY